ncbi:helix-turn-helix domain-containing protein [Bacillus mycoides]|uniref:helix-turn-helix domain-containing protein n=1 Tax=Bacillus mycoides TaxID=1405 RepID=UPI0011A7CA8D|nr:helix-turn-helix transcriptional regulator [Bacillus mycoides]
MFGKRLKVVREMRGLSQQALADKINKKKPTISNYETGYSKPSIYVLSDIADALCVSTDDLLGREIIK